MQNDFDFSENFILEDDVVLLRPLQQSDFGNLINFSINEPDTWQYSLYRPDNEENLRNYIASSLKARDNKTEYPFIVFDKISARYAGSTRFYDINLAYKTLQLGYTWYGREFRGTGLNKHCKFLMLSFAFENMGMERVEFRADAKNQRSIAAMKSIGCKVDGILRSHMPTYDENLRRDSIILSILKEEWFGEVKENLKSKL